MLIGSLNAKSFEIFISLFVIRVIIHLLSNKTMILKQGLETKYITE